MTPPILYGEFSPSPKLQQWLAAYWYFKVDDDVGEIEHTIPPNGGSVLSLLPDSLSKFSGPCTTAQSVTIRGGMSVYGAIFWPGAASAFFNVDMNKLKPPHTPAENILPADSNLKLSKLIEQGAFEGNLTESFDDLFSSLASAASPLDEVVMKAVFQITHSHGKASVQELMEGLPMSPRQFRRRFINQVGLSPKKLLRIQRLRRCMKESVFKKQSSWVELAANHGYADQAHLIREFRNVLGMTPSEFEAHFHSIKHQNVVR